MQPTEEAYSFSGRDGADEGCTCLHKFLLFPTRVDGKRWADAHKDEEVLYCYRPCITDSRGARDLAPSKDRMTFANGPGGSTIPDLRVLVTSDTEQAVKNPSDNTAWKEACSATHRICVGGRKATNQGPMPLMLLTPLEPRAALQLDLPPLA